VTKPVFTSVETQTDITWLNKADKPTRLMVKNTEKIVNSLKKVTNSSQTTSSSRTTTTSDSESSTSSNSSSHQNKKEQKPKAQNRSLSQRQSKAEKDPVQVHYRYGRLDDAEESVWNLPPDDSPSPMDESPSETISKG
jgi:Mg-chelatase subunit ChlI